MLFPPILDHKQGAAKDKIKIGDVSLDDISYVEAVSLYRRLVNQALQKDATDESRKEKESLRRILSAVRTLPKVYTQFDLTRPNDSLRDHLLQNHIRETFAYDTPSTFQSFIFMVGLMVYMLQSHYNGLDRRYGLRTDGTTRFSHAFGTLEILLKDFGISGKAEIFAALAHDYLEDMNTTHDERIDSLETVFTGEPQLKAESLRIIESLTKKELAIYITDDERISSGFIDNEFVKQNKKILKERRDSDYYNSIFGFDFITLAIKSADRLHALRHFDKNPVEKVVRKLEETKQYFIPAILNLIGRYEKEEVVPHKPQHILKLKHILYLLLFQMEKVSVVLEKLAPSAHLYEIDHESSVMIDLIDFQRYGLNNEQCAMMSLYEEKYYTEN